MKSSYSTLFPIDIARYVQAATNFNHNVNTLTNRFLCQSDRVEVQQVFPVL